MAHFAVIFDMDGVIVDSEPVYHNWNQELYKDLNITVPLILKPQIIGTGVRSKWNLIKQHCEISQTVEELIQYQQRFFRSMKVNFEDILFPGVKPLIKNLKKDKVSIALASSSDKERINRVLNDCELHQLFDVVVSGEEFEESKPNPEIFLHAAEKLGEIPEDCIVIEDSYNGLLAASRAGMKKIGVKHEHITMDLSLADLTVQSLEELNIKILKKLI